MYLAGIAYLIVGWSKAPVRDDEWSARDAALLKNLEEPMPDLTNRPFAEPYAVLEYIECGEWRQVYTGYSYEVAVHVGRGLKSEMPFRVMQCGRLVTQCHGRAEVIEA